VNNRPIESQNVKHTITNMECASFHHRKNEYDDMITLTTND